MLLEAFVVGVVGSTLGLGLGVLLAMAIRALFANFGLDLTGQPLIFAPRTVLACYVVGVRGHDGGRVAARPAGPTRIAPVQALRDDIALPGARSTAGCCSGWCHRGWGRGDGRRAVRRHPARRYGCSASGSSSCCSA